MNLKFNFTDSMSSWVVTHALDCRQHRARLRSQLSVRLLLDQLRQEDSDFSSSEQPQWAFPMQATALFENGGYNVTVDQGGLLSDFVGPGQTMAVYEVGCNGPPAN